MKSMIEALSAFGSSVREAGTVMREIGKLGISLPKRQEPELSHTSTAIPNSPIPEVQAGIDLEHPPVLVRYDADLGMGRADADQPSLIAGGITEVVAPGDSRLVPVSKPKKLQKTRSVRCL